MSALKRINESIALHMTKLFGTMWITYLFVVYGFLPLIFPHGTVALLYWSNTVQLWALPLIMVGQNVMGRGAEIRAQQDHEAIMQELEAVKEMHDSHAQELRDLKELLRLARGD